MSVNHFEIVYKTLIEKGEPRCTSLLDRAGFKKAGIPGGDLIGRCLVCDQEPMFKMFVKTAEAECPNCGETLAIRRLGKWARWVLPTPRKDAGTMEVAA